MRTRKLVVRLVTALGLTLFAGGAIAVVGFAGDPGMTHNGVVASGDMTHN